MAMDRISRVAEEVDVAFESKMIFYDVMSCG